MFGRDRHHRPRRAFVHGGATLLLLVAGVLLPSVASAADPEPITFAFWNVENLFDPEDDPENPGDDEFLPAQEWTRERYGRKLAHLAEVLAGLEASLIGLAEVENRRVLEDLLRQEALASRGYRIVHRDSPDKRGIDLALLYAAPLELEEGPGAVRLHEIPLDNPTRGVLEVRLRAAGAPLVVLVNHWPSRYGGTEKTRALRRQAAEVCLGVVKSHEEGESGSSPDLLLLGDFNDDPFDESVRITLGAVRSRYAVMNDRGRTRLYNPSWSFLGRSDTGTLYYWRDWVWNVFDQCIVSRGLLDSHGFEYVEGSLEIYSTEAMRDRYQRPKRFRKDRRRQQWVEGYSDHFPIRGRLVLHGSSEGAKERTGR